MHSQPIIQPSCPSGRRHLRCPRCFYLSRRRSCAGLLFGRCCPSCTGRFFLRCRSCPGCIFLSCCRRPGCPSPERLGRCPSLPKLHQRCYPSHERCRCRWRNRHCQQARRCHLHRCRQQGHGCLGCRSCRSPRSRRLPLVSGGISIGPSLRLSFQIISVFDTWLHMTAVGYTGGDICIAYGVYGLSRWCNS